MMSLGICFLSLAGQTAALDQKVSCEILRAPLRQVLAELAQKTGVRVDVKVAGKDFSSTVLVKDKPLRSVLEGLASVHGLALRTDFDPIRMVGTSSNERQNQYVRAEDEFLFQRAIAKLSALAELTNVPFGEQGRPVPAASDQSDRAWALRHIDRWPYYLAGMWRRMPVNGSSTPLNFSWYFHLHRGYPTPFTVMPPLDQRFAQGIAWIDENSKELAEHQILMWISPVTYELKIAGVYPVVTPPDSWQEFPYTFSAPPKELSKTPFAQELSAWQGKPESFEAPELRAKTTRSEITDPESWWTERSSLAYTLFSFYRANEVPIIADAYRVASRKSVKDISGNTKGAWLQDLQKKEECFVQYVNGIALVRHPAFWRLQQAEPTQDSLDRIEEATKKRPLNLDDYAQFMGANSTFMQVRFDSHKTCLVKFDPRPIVISGPALYSLGILTPKIRSNLYQGKPYLIDHGRFGRTGALGPFYGAMPKGASRFLLRHHDLNFGFIDTYRYMTSVHPLIRRPTPGEPEYLKGDTIAPANSGSIHIATTRMNPDLRNGEIDFGYTFRDVITYRLSVP